MTATPLLLRIAASSSPILLGLLLRQSSSLFLPHDLGGGFLCPGEFGAGLGILLFLDESVSRIDSRLDCEGVRFSGGGLRA